MLRERRCDLATAAPSRATRDRRGFLVVPAYVTRTGVLTYKRADGTVVRELRHPAEVFAPDSLATLHGAAVTIGHPGGGRLWVDSDNAAEHEVGIVHDAQRDGDFVRSRLSVRRAAAIRRIDARELLEISCGYDADIDPTPGTFEGQAFDQQQRNITYNHVALLPPGGGRAGRDVRLRADDDQWMEASAMARRLDDSRCDMTGWDADAVMRAELARKLEAMRTPPERRADGVRDFDAELRELEFRRANAWRAR